MHGITGSAGGQTDISDTFPCTDEAACGVCSISYFQPDAFK